MKILQVRFIVAIIFAVATPLGFYNGNMKSHAISDLKI